MSVMSFKDWKDEVIFYAKTEYPNLLGDNPTLKDFDWSDEAWGLYWTEGLTPTEAIITELQEEWL